MSLHAVLVVFRSLHGTSSGLPYVSVSLSVERLVSSTAEVDRLTEAVEEHERLAAPGGDLDHFLKVLRLNDDTGAAAMEVDGRPYRAPPRRQEASGGGGSSADSVDPGGAGAALPVPGAKRKRASPSPARFLLRPLAPLPQSATRIHCPIPLTPTGVSLHGIFVDAEYFVFSYWYFTIVAEHNFRMPYLCFMVIYKMMTQSM
ncbi:hypothetical protein EJB05_40333, partial [Eragrostis curvula]